VLLHFQNQRFAPRGTSTASKFRGDAPQETQHPPHRPILEPLGLVASAIISSNDWARPGIHGQFPVLSFTFFKRFCAAGDIQHFVGNALLAGFVVFQLQGRASSVALSVAFFIATIRAACSLASDSRMAW
jgi:hypothetical protein